MGKASKAEAPKAEAPTEVKVVEAVGSTSWPRGFSRMVEAAMAEAHLACNRAGISDPAKILKAKIAARAKVKQLFRDAANVIEVDD